MWFAPYPVTNSTSDDIVEIMIPHRSTYCRIFSINAIQKEMLGVRLKLHYMVLNYYYFLSPLDPTLVAFGLRGYTLDNIQLMTGLKLRDIHPSIFNSNLDWPDYMCMCLDCRRQPEYPEWNHDNAGKTNQLPTEGSWDHNLPAEGQECWFFYAMIL